MSNMKKNDTAVCVDVRGCGNLTLGKNYDIIDVSITGYLVINNAGYAAWYEKYHFDKAEKKNKQPSKPHTETDRRKAAKAVRELQKKLEKAIAKAVETGINVSDCTEIEMTYQPATPKMRKY